MSESLALYLAVVTHKSLSQLEGVVVSYFIDLSIFDQWVLFGELILVLLLVIESALVVLGITVLRAEHVVTLAGETQEAYFSFAFPACVLVRL